ncbi:MAG: hypothetical protein GWO20_13755 [Candidatus Korarchaeota archaeon]|nr:hypothetical protein [Candidatus Korarchaeota archaeon]NIU84476.1 hypothetical protein [Candidatus Thorarchaeota archaeon]NIW14552.1 hypothetical protein [Candidatus Thorarchaeota archaeon]NIW52624.1 hypothetical protein [Candidatus Korarchaeota archaeon]
MASEAVEQVLREEANSLKRTRYLLIVPLLFILFTLWSKPFSKPYHSLFQMFIAENFSLWQLVALFFSIGVLVEVVPMFLGEHFYLSRVTPFLFEGKRGSLHHYLMTGAYMVILVIPLLAWGIWTVFFENPLMALLIFLARRKGFLGDVYVDEMLFPVMMWFLSGVLTVLIGGSFSFYPKFKQKVEETLGKPIRELAKPEISWKERLKNMTGWIVFGALLPLYLLGGVSLLVLISLLGAPIGRFGVLISVFPSLTLAIASPLAWKFYKDTHYRRAGHVACVAGGSYIFSAVLGFFVFFFPPTLLQIVAFIIIVTVEAGILFVIGFLLRSKERKTE